MRIDDARRTALPTAFWQRWRKLSGRTRTFVALAVWVMLWQGILAGLRALEDPAFDLPLMTLDHQTTDLAALADGKPLIVNLWASWCPPCRREMPVLAAAQKQQPWASFVFANQGESNATVQRYLSDSQLELANVLLDRDTRLGFVAGSAALPITLFYDAQGQLVASHRGALTAASLADKLKQLHSSSSFSTQE